MNGSLLAIYRTSGEAGTMKFNLTYKFYSHKPYFILESKITPKLSETWDYYLNQQFFLKDGYFSRANWKNSTGIFEYSISSGNGIDKTSLGNLEWIAAYDNISGNSFGTIYLERSQSKSYTPNNAFYDEASYEYYKRTQYSGSVTASDYFYSKVAVVIWNALDGFEGLNETYYRLKNPVNVSIGISETYDVENPTYGIANYTPQSPNDTQNITCYSYWEDNLELDYALITINSSAFNNQTTLQIATNESWVNFTLPAEKLEAGQVTCNITLYDIAGLTNSTQFSFSVTDATPPYFIFISNYPSTNASLDPNVQVNVTVNLTEYSSIDSVILQYRNSSQQGWQEVTMNKVWNDTYSYSYSGNFIPDSEATWQYRIFVNDTLGNYNSSQTINLTVFYDWTWLHSPLDFGAVSGLLGENITLGNITINNTGDKLLSFKITSNWDNKEEIFYNDSSEGDTGFSFDLKPKNSTTISVKVRAKSTERSDSLTITIDALNSSAFPDSNTTTATIVSYASGPFLLVEITDYNISVTQGDTGIILKAKVQNKGNETATNAWLAFELPPGWSVTYGSLNSSIESLSVDEIAYNEITVSVAENAPTGTQTIKALAGCSENKTGSDSVSVVVMEKEVTAETTTTVPTRGGGGGTTSREPSLTKEQKEKLLQTEETFELVRGREKNFTLRVENPFDGILENVSVSISGFLAQYLRVEPSRVERIGINKSFNFTIWIEAPKYFTKGEYKLNFTITGIVNKTRIIGNVTRISVTYLRESRLVTLIIHEISREEAESFLKESFNLVEEMKKHGLNTEEVEFLLSKARDSFEDKDYEEVKKIYEMIKDKKEKAFATLSLLEEVEEKINEALYNGIKVPKTGRLLLLAKAALSRGDYKTALKRAEDAKLTYALETAGKFNPVAFVKNNWPKLTLAGFGIGFASYLGFLSFKFNLVSKKLRSLKEEEEVLLGLIKEIQRECFEKKKLSMKEYFETLNQYEKRLSKVIQETIKLQTIKAHLFKLFKGEDKRMLEEKKALLNLIKKTQRLYLESGKLDTRLYKNRMKSYVERLAEIEERLASLEAEKVGKFKVG